ncbi:MAG: hypothetical protein JJU11_00310 [Candidatus Sumerlaeia bacterium]|nr:hypothetical protein [Candidatus Sumerlaeia bacterium]
MWKPDPKKWLKRKKPESASRAVAPSPKQPRSQRPIVLIHGLNMPRAHLIPIGWRLSRSMGRPVHYFPYTSRLRDIPDTAIRLSQWLEERRISEFDAVTHSMGGVILRWAMTHCDMPTLHRAVLVAPPNEGTWLANHLNQKLGVLFPLLFGQAAMQLRAGDLGIAGRAGDLGSAEAGVIAGGSGQPTGIRNWFKIPGDCDGTVAVEETIFPGMKDFVLLPGNHTNLVMARRTAELTRVFLETGLFRPGRKASSH